MISFFEMFNLMRENPNWGNLFDDEPDAPAPMTAAAPPQPVVPTPAPAPRPAPQAAPAPAAAAPGLKRRVVMRSQDPNAELSGKKNLRYKMDPHSRSMVKTGRYDHGSDRQDVNDTDAEMNAADRRLRKAERGPDVGYANLHSVLTAANDPTGKIKPDFLASRILKHLEGNPAILDRGRPYSATELYQVLRPILSNYQPAEVIPSLDRLASFGKDSPLKRVDSAGPDGTRQHGYIFNRTEGIMDDDPDDSEFARPRYQNPALRGGVGSVGVPKAQRPGSQAAPAPKSAAEAMLDSFSKIADQLDRANSGQIGVPETQKLTILNQMKELQAQAKQMLATVSQADNVDPSKAKNLEQVIALMDQEIRRYNPANWVKGEPTPEYKPAVKRRPLPYDQAIQGTMQGRQFHTGDDPELDAEIDREIAARRGAVPKREWSYYYV